MEVRAGMGMSVGTAGVDNFTNSKERSRVPVAAVAAGVEVNAHGSLARKTTAGSNCRTLSSSRLGNGPFLP